MKVNDVIDVCLNGGNPDRGNWRLTGLVLHRFKIQDIDSGVGVAELLKTEPTVGRCMSYHFVVRTDGTIDQCLPLNKIGWHAMKHSRYTLGIAVIGDFREHEPTEEQVKSLVWLVKQFGAVFGRFDVAGHTNLKNATSDPTKICPGPLLDARKLISQVKLEHKLSGIVRLEEAGVVLKRELL